ncbi:MAG: hypothetical protein JXB40_05005, partial [Candidatus Omnitrophica bacterium]|nr:hypothetical protein [Candidatus Omnitrophota bacterium]
FGGIPPSMKCGGGTISRINKTGICTAPSHYFAPYASRAPIASPIRYFVTIPYPCCRDFDKRVVGFFGYKYL